MIYCVIEGCENFAKIYRFKLNEEKTIQVAWHVCEDHENYDFHHFKELEDQIEGRWGQMHPIKIILQKVRYD